MPRIDLIQLRRDTAANWSSANPVLAVGEEGHETDTGKRKIGDGTTHWNDQPYAFAQAAITPPGSQTVPGAPTTVYDALMATGVRFSRYNVNNVFGGEGDPGQFDGYNIPNIPTYDPTKWGMYIGWEPNYNDGDGTGHGGSVPNDLNVSIKSEHYWQFDVPRVAEVVVKTLTSNVATLTTRWHHPYTVGETITVAGVDSTFNGTYVVTAITARTVSYAKAATNVSAVASGGSIDMGSDPTVFYRTYYAWINHADGSIGMVLTADSWTVGTTSGAALIGASASNVALSVPLVLSTVPVATIGSSVLASDAVLNFDGNSANSASLINFLRNGTAAWKFFRVGGFSDYMGLWDYANSKYHVLYTRGAGAGGGSTDFGSAVTIAGNVGFYGHAAVARASALPSDATDLASAIALVNRLKADLIANGLEQ